MPNPTGDLMFRSNKALARVSALAIALATFGGGLAVPAAQAQTAQFTFTIPSQDLGRAL